MADSVIRRIGRAETSAEDQARTLATLIRSGRLPERRLELARYLCESAPAPRDEWHYRLEMAPWYLGLLQFGSETRARLRLAAARLVWQSCEGRFLVESRVERGIHRLAALLERPDDAEVEAAAAEWLADASQRSWHEYTFTYNDVYYRCSCSVIDGLVELLMRFEAPNAGRLKHWAEELALWFERQDGVVWQTLRGELMASLIAESLAGCS